MPVANPKRANKIIQSKPDTDNIRPIRNGNQINRINADIKTRIPMNVNIKEFEFSSAL